MMRRFNLAIMKFFNDIDETNFKFRTVLDCSQDSICITDKLKLSYCNDNFVNLFNSNLNDITVGNILTNPIPSTGLIISEPENSFTTRH